MALPPIQLEEPYRSRAAPPATARYWSWLFAAPDARDPLLGVYALGAEWRALTDPSAEHQAAGIKLAWWHEEIVRLAHGAPLHPITRFLASLPRADRVDFAPLNASLEAAASHIAGAPLEHGSEIESHGASLSGAPLMTAAHLAHDITPGCEPAVQRAVSTLAAAQYLQDSIADYRRDALRGRVIFPVDELLAAGIEDADLTAHPAPGPLQAYLDDLRSRAARLFAAAAGLLPDAERAPLRHLLVLAALGARHSRSGAGSGGAAVRTGAFRPADLYQAWRAARRASRH